MGRDALRPTEGEPERRRERAVLSYSAVLASIRTNTVGEFQCVQRAGGVE